MPRLAVVYDSNVYRGLTPDRATAIRAREASYSILGYANYSVVGELLAHLADPDDRAFHQAMAALTRLWAHCTQYDGSAHGLRFIADSESQLSHSLFGHGPPNLARERGLYAGVIGEIITSPDPNTWTPAA